ncbi:hypothetical protein ACO0KY_04890 [Undibacterium sp. Dicai25W]
MQPEEIQPEFLQADRMQADEVKTRNTQIEVLRVFYWLLIFADDR